MTTKAGSHADHIRTYTSQTSVDGQTTWAENVVIASNYTSNPLAVPTVTATTYTANRAVGTLLTFSNAFDAAGSGVLLSIAIRMKTVQTAGFKLAVFNANPTATTITDNGAIAIAAADIAKLAGIFDLSNTYSSALGTHTLYQLNNIGAVVAAGAGNTSLYGVLFTTGTPTFASTSDIVNVGLGIRKD